MGYDKSEHGGEVGTGVPTSLTELGTRILMVVKLVGGPVKAADLLGIKKYATVTSWCKGETRAPFEALATLAMEAGVSLDWLAYGRGEMLQAAGDAGLFQGQRQAATASIDPELMGRVYDVIVRTYKDEGMSLPTIDAGRLAAEHYELVAASVEGPDDWPPTLKMLAAQLRKAIHAAAAAPGSNKQRA